MRQIPLAIGLDATPSFEDFVPGPNREALEHLSSLPLSAGQAYLWGPPGSGKTHLLRAAVAAMQARGERAGWFRPGDPGPWQLDEDWSALVIDDCDRLDALEQRAAFSLFVEAAERGIGIGAAGRLPPVDLPLRDDLRSRLGWCHVFALHSLDEPDARSALRREADRRGLFLSDEVMAFVMRRFSRDMKSLMALLDAIDRFAWVERRPITLAMVRRMLADDEALEPSAT